MIQSLPLLFIFVLLKHNFFKQNCRILQDLNLHRRSCAYFSYRKQGILDKLGNSVFDDSEIFSSPQAFKSTLPLFHLNISFKGFLSKGAKWGYFCFWRCLIHTIFVEFNESGPKHRKSCPHLQMTKFISEIKEEKSTRLRKEKASHENWPHSHQCDQMLHLKS